jgi:hypothetical protein
MKTRLDLILDQVVARKSEVTLDCEGYAAEQIERVIDAARGREFSACFDGRFLLIRDLRQMHQPPLS